MVHMRPNPNVLKESSADGCAVVIGGGGAAGASVQLWTWCGAAVAVWSGLGRLQLPSEGDLDVAQRCCFHGVQGPGA